MRKVVPPGDVWQHRHARGVVGISSSRPAAGPRTCAPPTITRARAAEVAGQRPLADAARRSASTCRDGVSHQDCTLERLRSNCSMSQPPSEREYLITASSSPCHTTRRDGVVISWRHLLTRAWVTCSQRTAHLPPAVRSAPFGTRAACRAMATTPAARPPKTHRAATATRRRRSLSRRAGLRRRPRSKAARRRRAPPRRSPRARRRPRGSRRAANNSYAQ